LFVCQFAAVKTGGTFNFYFTLSRGWELALGGISAYYLFKKKNLSSNNISNNLLTSIGLSNEQT
jgi:LPXTG-motif cell wall-anchored protein